jgi:serine/threonine-protein kinase
VAGPCGRPERLARRPLRRRRRPFAGATDRSPASFDRSPATAGTSGLPQRRSGLSLSGRLDLVDQLREGLVLGHRFRLIEPVRAGGARRVWRAADEAGGHDVAVKALGARAAWSMSERARLRIAFAATSELASPGIARVHEYGELALPGGFAVPYLVRELVSGRSLEERLAGGSLPVDEALGVVARVADALAAAHRAGVVHGNLVPGNVVFGKDGVKVTDFGLWAVRDHLAGAPRLTAHTSSVLSYSAPERLSGEPPSPAADMYSLGVLFVACLSGIAAGGTAGAWPAAGPEDSVAPSLATLWAACLGANPQERPSAAHAAFMSRQILAAYPAALSGRDDLAARNGHATEPAAAPSPDRLGLDRLGPERGGRDRLGSERASPVLPSVPAPGSTAGKVGVPGRESPAGGGAGDQAGVLAPAGQPGTGQPGTNQPGHGRRARRGRQRGSPPGHGRSGHGLGARPPGRRHGPGTGARDLGQALRGRAGLVTLGGAAGITAAVVMLTQFLASPSAQTTGAAPTPPAPVSQPAVTPSGSHPQPSVNATASVLASAPPSPPQVLNQIRGTLQRGVTDGQVRQDVAVDLDNLLQPIQSDLAAGNSGAIPQLVAGLRTKLAARLSEGAISRAAGRQLSRELTTLLRSVGGH